VLAAVPNPTSSRDKPSTRRTLRSRRDALSERERAVWSDAIAERAMQLLEAKLPSGANVALYAAKGSEVDTARIDDAARNAGFGVVYPRVNHPHRALTFHAVAIGELVSTRWGLREPAVGAPLVELAAIGGFLIPGLAFDRAGGRIGWGMGHYDVTLAGVPSALRVGLAFDCQVLDEVPHEPHDVVLDFILTEAAAYAVG
jgi:5-formyltetrahydrofolate cyclo-ligase